VGREYLIWGKQKIYGTVESQALGEGRERRERERERE